MTTADAGRRPARHHNWRVPAALIALSAIPLTAGILRLTQLAGGHGLAPDIRFQDFPAPIVVHVVSAAVFALLGAFQFARGFRRRHRTWHRRAGRVLVAAGLLVAASALTATLMYTQKPGTGDLLYVTRLVVGSATAAFLILGLSAARRRALPAHRAWMMRAYALGLGAGTQIFTEGLGKTIFGTGVLPGDLEKVAAWVINLAVAETLIRRNRRPVPSRDATVHRAISLTGAKQGRNGNELADDITVIAL
jgi:uncharacterized membrane protein YozB (DUF420 family)